LEATDEHLSHDVRDVPARTQPLQLVPRRRRDAYGLGSMGCRTVNCVAPPSARRRAVDRRLGMCVLLSKQVPVSRPSQEALPGSASNAAEMSSANGPSLPLGNATRALGALTTSVVPVSG
jgi:hypothetical protein